VRVAGYVRESIDPGEDRPAFAQQEEIRRYALENGLQVIALCRDVRQPGAALGSDGYRTLLGIIAGGTADAALLPGLATLSSDLVVQEIMLWDLRSRGIKVLSTDPTDLPILAGDDLEPSRSLVRHVLGRVAEYARTFDPAPPPAEIPPPDPDGVVVRLVPPAPDTDDGAAAGPG
jgi:hypothetical protein